MHKTLTSAPPLALVIPACARSIAGSCAKPIHGS